MAVHHPAKHRHWQCLGARNRDAPTSTISQPTLHCQAARGQHDRLMVCHRRAARCVRRLRHIAHRGFPRMDSVRQFLRDEDGQDVVEYGLLIATIAIVVLLATTLFGDAIRGWFTLLAERITTNTGG